MKFMTDFGWYNVNSLVSVDVVAPVVAVESFESNLANKKFATNSSVVTLVFTATDSQVMPTGAPSEVAIGGTTTGLTLKSNVAVVGTNDKSRRYTYEFTVGAATVDGATIGFWINVTDGAGNPETATSIVNDLVTVGTLSSVFF